MEKETSQIKFLRSVIRITVQDSIKSERIRQNSERYTGVRIGLAWTCGILCPAYFYIPLGEQEIGHLRSRWKGHFI
jgi:hypothetical protein